MSVVWRGLASAAVVAGVVSSAPAPASSVHGASVTFSVAADDTMALTRLLRSVRGADPLFCEMAARNVDAQGWWSSGGSEPGGALETDSASAEIVRWIRQRKRDPRLVPTLSVAMRDTDRCVRRLAGAFLGRIAHPSALAALHAALNDGGADTREVAAIGLGLAEDRTAVAPLVQRLKDPSPGVRRSAAWALGEIGEKAALADLVALLERDPDARVRQAAAWAIGHVAG